MALPGRQRWEASGTFPLDIHLRLQFSESCGYRRKVTFLPPFPPPPPSIFVSKNDHLFLWLWEKDTLQKKIPADPDAAGRCKKHSSQ